MHFIKVNTVRKEASVEQILAPRSPSKVFNVAYQCNGGIRVSETSRLDKNVRRKIEWIAALGYSHIKLAVT